MIDSLLMLAWERRRMASWHTGAPPGPEACARWAGAGSRGVVVLSTCERFEVYATDAAGFDGSLIRALFPAGSDLAEAHATRRSGAEAGEHVLRVASGLDSRLIGEPHVLGQVRRAGERAAKAGVIGPALPALFARAVRCGRRVRAETLLGRVASTYAGVAADRVSHALGSCAGARVGIVGTGAVAMEVGERLRSRGIGEIMIFGRHPKRTGALARHLGGDAAALDELGGRVSGLGALITATSAPRPVVDQKDVRAANGLLVIDLGMPPNVAPGAIGRPGIEHVGLDDLVPDHLPSREIVADAERIVRQELARLGAAGASSTGARTPTRRRGAAHLEVTR